MSHDGSTSPELDHLRKRAEAELHRQPQVPSETSIEGIDKLVHELRTHQIELEMQNEELRRAQEGLLESRDDYADLYDFAPVGYVTVSNKGLVLKANLTFADLLGKERRSLFKERFSAFVVSDDQDNYYKFHRTLLENQEKQSCELRIHKEGDDPFWVRLDGAAVQKNEGREIQLRLAITDINARKRMEEELARSKKAADSANQAKSEFLANMSHEIRTPMTAILGYTDILLEDEVKQENIASLRTIKRNGDNLINLINNILDLSKIESGKVEVEKIDYSPIQVIAGIASLMRVQAKAKGLALEVHFESPIPETICTDPTRLRQIVTNVVGNAIKFTEMGLIQIVTRLLNETGEEPKLQINVIDTGIGISEGIIEKLFQPFTQADYSTTRQFGGTGLGLSISKEMAELLGGKISATSTVGKGSTFSVVVPTGPLDDVRLIQVTHELITSATDEKGIEGSGLSLQNCRILLVEDFLDILQIMSSVFRKLGAEVTPAENGQIAYDLAIAAADENSPFDVILMDMQMPIMDGYEATRRLRNEGYSGPIVALTAHAMTTDCQKCLDAGCDDYASKPIDREQLISIVSKYALRNNS